MRGTYHFELFYRQQFCSSFAETSGTRVLFAFFSLLMLIINVAKVLLDAQ